MRDWIMIMSVIIDLSPLRILQKGGIITRNLKAVILPLNDIVVFASRDSLHPIRSSGTNATPGRGRFPAGDISAGRVYTRVNMKVKLKNIPRCVKKVQMSAKLV